MQIELLRVDGLRNLTGVDIQPAPGINVIYGDNASGKTSLLESIYLLGRGRSFRSQRAHPLIQRGKKAFTVFSRLSGAHGERKTIGIKRSTAGIEIHIDRDRVKRVSELAKVFPFQIVTPRSQEILEKGAAYRRRMLDWGVFHVEPGFHLWHSRYRTALLQRNAALRQGVTSLDVWDREMVLAADRIDLARNRYLECLKVNFETVAESFSGLDDQYVFRFSRGYPNDRALSEVLAASRDEDRKRGYTYYGPHRADFRLLCERGDAFDIASGGQKRLLVCAINIAQASVVREKTGQIPIWLLDDLPAEFDRRNREAVLTLVGGIAEQVFVTTTEPELVAFEGMSIAKMFHVEHGQIL